MIFVKPLVSPTIFNDWPRGHEDVTSRDRAPVGDRGGSKASLAKVVPQIGRAAATRPVKTKGVKGVVNPTDIWANTHEQ
jgi:hypothetical protein